MKIRPYRESDLHRPFAFWTEVRADVPYLFPVSAERWRTCLLEDTLDGERLFENVETQLATEGEQIVGFVQYGRPRLAWDESGRAALSEPTDRRGPLALLPSGARRRGEALLARADDGIQRFNEAYAFYHALGMSCAAYHGKLHESQSHVERILRRYRFRVEHENIY